MTLARLVLPLVLLCSVVSCSDNETADPVSPILLSLSKSDLVATWRGTMSSVSFDLGTVEDSSLVYSDISCMFNIYPFEYEVQLISFEDDKVTTYTEGGDWKWEAEEPGEIVFFNQEESFLQEYEEKGQVRRFRGATSTNGQWSGRLDISEDLATLKIFAGEKNIGIGEYRSGAVFDLKKIASPENPL